MGSLMAGWDSPVIDSNKGGLERNKSLTKEEIENYWRLKRRVEEEHLKALAEVSLALPQSLGAAGDEGDQTPQQRPVSGRPTRLETSNSFPAAGSRFLKDEESERNMRAWWTRSNWAFLNEPPLREMEGPAYKYAAQYHIADPSDRVSNILGDPKTAMPPDGVASMS